MDGNSPVMLGFMNGRLLRRLDLNSHIDMVTGLWDRRYFCLRLAKEKTRAIRKKTSICMPCYRQL